MQNLEQFLRQTTESLRLGNFAIKQRDADGYVDVLPFCTEFNVSIEDYLSDKLAQPELAVLKSSSKLTIEELIQDSPDNIWVYPELAYDFLFYVDMSQGLSLGGRLIKWFESKVIKLVEKCDAVQEEGDPEKAHALMDEFLALERRAEILNAKMHSAGRTLQQTIQKVFFELYNEEQFIQKKTDNSSKVYQRAGIMNSGIFGLFARIYGISKDVYFTISFLDGTVTEFFGDDIEIAAEAFAKANQDLKKKLAYAQKEKKGCVYFILDKECNAVKVGYTTNLRQRLDALQAANSSTLKILKSIKGDIQLERTIHGKFKHLRLHGEWFKATPELMKYILSL